MPLSDGLKQRIHSDAAQQLQVIYADIDQRVRGHDSSTSQLACRLGRDNCCRQLAQPPEMTASEWHVIQQGFAQLPPETQHEVARRVQALAHWHGEPVICPFLDATQGACLIYAHRPAACRMYGFYVSRTAHWWCSDIQALYDTGAVMALSWGITGRWNGPYMTSVAR